MSSKDSGAYPLSCPKDTEDKDGRIVKLTTGIYNLCETLLPLCLRGQVPRPWSSCTCGWAPSHQDV